MVIWCSDGEGPVQVRTSGNRKAVPGERLSLGLDPSQISLFAAASGDRL